MMAANPYDCAEDLFQPEEYLKRAYEFKVSKRGEISKQQMLVMTSFPTTFFLWGYWTFKKRDGSEESIDDLAKTPAFNKKPPSEQARIKRLLNLARNERKAFFEDKDHVQRAKKLARIVSDAFSTRDVGFSRIVERLSKPYSGGKITIICNPRAIFLMDDSHDAIVVGKFKKVKASMSLLAKGACVISMIEPRDDSGAVGEASAWILPGEKFDENAEVLLVDKAFHEEYLFSETEIVEREGKTTHGLTILKKFEEFLLSFGLKPRIVYMDEVI